MSEYNKRINDREFPVNYESTLRVSKKRYSENNDDKIEKDFLLSIGRQRLDKCSIFSITDLSEDNALLY